MKLYIEGHSAKRGYAVSRTWSDDELLERGEKVIKGGELEPVRFFSCSKRAFSFVERYNRMFATH